MSSPADLDLPPLEPTPPGLYQHYKGGWYEVLDTVLRPAPTTCCGRGCNGCVWEYYFAAVRQWRDEACGCLSNHPVLAAT